MPIHVNGSGSSFIPEDPSKKEQKTSENKGLFNKIGERVFGTSNNTKAQPITDRTSSSSPGDTTSKKTQLSNPFKYWKVDDKTLKQPLLTDQHEEHLLLDDQHEEHLLLKNNVKPRKLIK